MLFLNVLPLQMIFNSPTITECFDARLEFNKGHFVMHPRADAWLYCIWHTFS